MNIRKLACRFQHLSFNCPISAMVKFCISWNFTCIVYGDNSRISTPPPDPGTIVAKYFSLCKNYKTLAWQVNIQSFGRVSELKAHYSIQSFGRVSELKAHYSIQGFGRVSELRAHCPIQINWGERRPQQNL